MTQYRFLAPLDVLFLRGNKLFGDAGSYGESLVPPWPSVAAGAIRSQMLAQEGVDLAAFAAGEITHPQLGTPEQPGSFAISEFALAHRDGSEVRVMRQLPADLIASAEGETLRIDRLRPEPLPEGIEGSRPLPKVPLLKGDARSKPETGLWLTEQGWRRYLRGELPQAGDLKRAAEIWKVDPRVGVGLDEAARRASDGKLFTTQAIVFKDGYGFLAGVDGAEPPAEGMVRLGGDGRGASVETVDWQAPEADLEAIVASGRCRIVLTSPGIFADGWKLPGCDEDGRFELGSVRGRITAAAVPRAETVSGWDLARKMPKAASKAAPAGSVYWLESLEATVSGLRELMARGLWGARPDPQRRAEGFNRFVFAND